ncbi:hypothetical protein MPER_14300, partial [Moniliophthora perniciosa FA553]
IKQNYAEIEQLANEKIAISQRIIELISRTSARLDVDLNKVRQLQGDTHPVESYSAKGGISAVPTLTASEITRNSGMSSRDPASSLSESLRIALNVPASESRKAAAATENASITPSTK